MRLGLNLPNSPSKDGEPILVWGGSTSVGLYALQLLKASGYTPISVSSPKNFDLVKKFGAAAVFDCEPPGCTSFLSLSLSSTTHRGSLDKSSPDIPRCSTDNDPEAPAKIAKAYPSLQYGLDCISEGKTTVSIVKAIAAAKGVGRVVSREAALEGSRSVVVDKRSCRQVTLLVNKDSEIKEYADKVKVEMTLVCECCAGAG